MATSGIETIIRLWSPLAEEGVVNDRIVDDWTTVASANQKRMNTNPFEMILMNMGYRVTPDDDTSDGDPPHDSSVQCSST
jgi:WD and tetratricopeptide repeat-containing protein 1